MQKYTFIINQIHKIIILLYITIIITQQTSNNTIVYEINEQANDFNNYKFSLSVHEYKNKVTQIQQLFEEDTKLLMRLELLDKNYDNTIQAPLFIASTEKIDTSQISSSYIQNNYEILPFKIDYENFALRNQVQYIEYEFEPIDHIYFSLKEMDTTKKNKFLTVNLIIEIVPKSQCQSNCPYEQQKCPIKDQFETFYGQNCQQAYQLLDTNFKYSFNKNSQKWMNFAMQIDPAQKYSFKIFGLGVNSFFHYEFLNWKEENQYLQKPNFLENTYKILGEKERLFTTTITNDQILNYTQDCFDEEQQEIVQKQQQPTNMNGQSLSPVKQCIQQKLLIVSLYFPEKTSISQDVEMEIREIEHHSYLYFLYIAICLAIGLIIVIVILYCVFYWATKKLDQHQEQENQAYMANQIQNQQDQENQQENQVQRKIVHVVITTATIEKYMPQRQYSDLIENMPEIQEQEDCFICLNKFEQEDICRMTVCLHVFHLSCVDVWIKNNGSCPYCRQQINRKILEDTETRKKNIKKNPFLKKIIDSQIKSVISSSSDGGSCAKKKMKEFDFMYEEEEYVNSQNNTPNDKQKDNLFFNSDNNNQLNIQKEPTKKLSQFNKDYSPKNQNNDEEQKLNESNLNMLSQRNNSIQQLSSNLNITENNLTQNTIEEKNLLQLEDILQSQNQNQQQQQQQQNQQQ